MWVLSTVVAAVHTALFTHNIQSKHSQQTCVSVSSAVAKLFLLWLITSGGFWPCISCLMDPKTQTRRGWCEVMCDNVWVIMSYDAQGNEPWHPAWPHLSVAGLSRQVLISLWWENRKQWSHISPRYCQRLMGTVWHEASSRSQPGNWTLWPITGQQLLDVTWHICTRCEEILMSWGVTTGLCFHCNLSLPWIDILIVSNLTLNIQRPKPYTYLLFS